MREDALLRIKPALEDHLAKSGYVLVDARFTRREGMLILEILVDRSEGGITLDECAALNRELGAMIEESGAFLERYTLDISSPGLDRPLATLADFRRTIGKDVRIFLREAVDGKIEFRGTIESADEENLTIKTGETILQIPLDKINKAKQVIS